ncbi:MAG: hypothetical protein WC764_00200 [Candidatus Paceibacterota bacterium]|jgi:hypothetical protein
MKGNTYTKAGKKQGRPAFRTASVYRNNKGVKTRAIKASFNGFSGNQKFPK